MDNKAINHIFNKVEWFKEFYPLDTPRRIASHLGGYMLANKIGIIRLPVNREDKQICSIFLKNAIYTPYCPYNSVSEGQFKENYSLIINGYINKLGSAKPNKEIA